MKSVDRQERLGLLSFGFHLTNSRTFEQHVQHLNALTSPQSLGEDDKAVTTRAPLPLLLQKYANHVFRLDPTPPTPIFDAEIMNVSALRIVPCICSQQAHARVSMVHQA